MGSSGVRDVVRDVVVEVAEEELPIVDGLARLDDAGALRRLRRRGRRREPLGFGLGEVVALVTPVVWLVVDQVARQVSDAAVEGVTERAKAVLRRILRRPPAPVQVPPLTREQLAEVHRQVIETAVRRGLPEERATEIADAVHRRLTLDGPGAGTDGA